MTNEKTNHWQAEKERYSAWLRDLKSGDLVLIRPASRYAGLSQDQVKSVTPSGQIVTGNGLRFNPDGWQRGAGYNRARLEEPTEDRLAQIRRASLIGSLSRVDWDKLPTETLERVKAALEGEVSA